MFKDTVKITITSGEGGSGSTLMYGTKPIGGDGGNGGDIIFKGSSSKYDLSHLSPSKEYRARNGKPGNTKIKKGAKGEDLIIEVPVNTEIYDGTELTHRITENQEKKIILEGGTGGLGSISLTGNNFRGQIYIPKTEGKQKEITLVIKLTSDVLFFGLPNAGKSSMLNELAHTAVKTASYSFTTLEPQIGTMDGLILMDLPGLIEGTAEGKGVGDNFVKHTEKANLIAHFVSLEEKDPISNYHMIRKELSTLPKRLYEMKEVIILTKYDEISEERRDELLEEFKKINPNVTYSSIIDEKSLERVRELIKKNFS